MLSLCRMAFSFFVLHVSAIFKSLARLSRNLSPLVLINADKHCAETSSRRVVGMPEIFSLEFICEGLHVVIMCWDGLPSSGLTEYLRTSIANRPEVYPFLIYVYVMA